MRPTNILCVAIILFFVSCGKKNLSNEEPLARAAGKYLYRSDVKDIFYATNTEADSARVLQVYINNWMKNQLLAQVAEKNLSIEEKDVAQELEEYRNSLLIHRYQNRLLYERLDTAVTEEQLRAYFDKNKNSFELAKNIVQLTFVKMDAKSKHLNETRKLFLSLDIKSKKELAKICEKHATNFFLDDEAWLDFSEVQKELPIKQYDEEHFLRNNKFLEIKDGSDVYLILIKSYRTKNSLSSFEFEKERIRNVLINQRKIELLQHTEFELMQRAIEKKEIENYTKE